MTVAQPTPSITTPPRNRRWSGYAHLLTARLLELKREPEVIFWVFGFPILLALGLGIAFRNKPADVTPAAIVAGPGAQNAWHSFNDRRAVPRFGLTSSMSRRRNKDSAWENTIW